jgi:PGAP1-like protein
MSRLSRQHLADLRGASRMAVDATLGITGLVEQLHHTIQRRPLPLGRPAVTGQTRGITGLVYRSVRGTTRLVGAALDVALQPLASWLPVGEPSPQRDAIVSIINGLYGDYLARTGNPLTIDMSLRHENRRLDAQGASSLRTALALPGGQRRLLVLVHGLCLNERHWLRGGHDHGAALSQDLGFVPLYVRYNSGLRIAANGRALAQTLDRLLRDWEGPTPELVILAHSMGGLVARSAFLYAQRARHGWLARVTDCVFLGTPHHGAPLERAGHGLDQLMDMSPYVAPFTRLGKARSAGINDLRHGNVTRRGGQFVQLPRQPRSYAIAATLQASRGTVTDRLLGDGLVPVDSALGRHPKPLRQLAIAEHRQWIGYAMGHLDLLGSTEVYRRLREWLA